MTSGVGVVKVSTFPPQRAPMTAPCRALRGFLHPPRSDEQILAIWLTIAIALGVTVDGLIVYGLYRWLRT